MVLRGGGCGFAQKAWLAQEAGAVALVVVNVPPRRQRDGLFRMRSGGTEDEIVRPLLLPALMLSVADAQAVMQAALAQHEDADELEAGAAPVPGVRSAL